jgi:hypothetical protein
VARPFSLFWGHLLGLTHGATCRLIARQLRTHVHGGRQHAGLLKPGTRDRPTATSQPPTPGPQPRPRWPNGSRPRPGQYVYSVEPARTSSRRWHSTRIRERATVGSPAYLRSRTIRKKRESVSSKLRVKRAAGENARRRTRGMAAHRGHEPSSCPSRLRSHAKDIPHLPHANRLQNLSICLPKTSETSNLIGTPANSLPTLSPLLRQGGHQRRRRSR